MVDIRFLVLEWPSSFLVVSFLAFWVTLWAPGYWKLVKKICFLLFGIQLNETTPVADPDTVPNILGRTHTADEAVIKLFPVAVELGIVAPSFAIALGVFSVLAIAGAGTAVGFLVLDNNALATNDMCGMWVPSDINNTTANPMGSVMDIIESYYKSCYESVSSTQGCGLFADDNLHVVNMTLVECPFVGDVCLLGKYSAISFDIGDLDSKFFGINSRHRPIIRRRSICAPIVTHGYYDNTTTSFTNISFHYGLTSTGDNATYTQTRSR